MREKPLTTLLAFIAAVLIGSYYWSQLRLPMFESCIETYPRWVCDSLYKTTLYGEP